MAGMELSARADDSGFGTAVRQVSWQFGILTAVGLIAVVNQPDRHVLWVVALIFAGTGIALRMTPAQFWGPRSLLWLTLVLFVSLGVSTWSADDRAIVTSPGFLIAYVWMGLHQHLPVVVLSVPFAVVSYWLALRLAGTPDELAGSALVVVPVAALVGAVMSLVVAEAQRAKAEIRADERWRAAIMATLAHDVRSPLTSIIGALEILADDVRTPDSQRVLIDGANRQAGRILRLAAGLLEVERVDQGRLRLDRHNLVLMDLLHDIAASQPALGLVIDVPPHLTVWADRERLEQVLVNLANNAARHGSPPVVVSATSNSEGITISVRDHGTGVPAPDVGQLFERFSSADHSPQSVGLGLWIVRLLTEAHGGSISYEAAEPGARFVVRLPPATLTVPLEKDVPTRTAHATDPQAKSA